MAEAFFVVNNVLAVLVAVFAADIFMKGRESWQRVLAVVAGFVLVVLFVVLSLGLIGRLSAISAAILLGISNVVLAIVRRRFYKDKAENLAEVSLSTGLSGSGKRKFTCVFCWWEGFSE